jgi:hypothetical protein
LIYYSKPFDLLHGTAFQARTWLETLLGTFVKNAASFAYNMMHL